MLRGMGSSDGRRNRPIQLLPNLGQMPWTQYQKAAMDARARAVLSAAPFVHPTLGLLGPAADSDCFTVTPTPYPFYPLPGNSAIVVISLTVPRSKLAVIKKIAVANFGGIVPDGTGRVIWRVKKNGGGLRGLSGLMGQFGTMAGPKDVNILAVENDIVSVTVECPAFLPDGVTPNPGMPGGATTAASFDGFMYPLSEATRPQQGNY